MLEEVFNDILTKRDKWIEREKGGGPRIKRNPTAGDISSCARETALAILHYDARPDFPTDLLHRFECGDDGELRGKRKLMELGFDVIESQRMLEFHDDRGRLIVRGKVDGLLSHPLWEKPLLFDHKTINPNLFSRLYTVEDCLKMPLTRKWVKQIQIYMFLLEHPVSFLLLDNLLGQWRPIEVPFLEDVATQALNQCREAVDAIEAIHAGHLEEEALPPYHVDSAECEKCWCRGRVCFPPMVREGYQAIDDDVLAGLLDRRAALRESAKEYETIDAEVKKMVSGKHGLIVGNWLIEGEQRERNYKEQPAKPAHKQTYWQSKFVQLQEMKNVA